MAQTSKILRGRVAIITGAGKGLGRAWALQLAKLGAQVVVNNRASGNMPGSSSADAVVEQIRAAGGEAIANYESVEAPEAGNRLVAMALEHFGALDIVIANAGIDRASSFHKQDLTDFELVVEINFLAVARLLHTAWPVLREANYGRILVATSTAGLYGNHGQAAYSSSKAALQGLVKALAIEGSSRNMQINTIAPYAVTQLTRDAFPAQQLDNFSPEATAELVAWLVSEGCELTGKTLIAGANRARLVQTQESDTLSLGEDIPAAAGKLMALPCPHIPASAIEEFGEFTLSPGL